MASTSLPQFSVNDDCISCENCTLVAPDHFEIDDDLGRSHVVKQPTTQAEVDVCQEALDGCPVEAIERQDP